MQKTTAKPAKTAPSAAEIQPHHYDDNHFIIFGNISLSASWAYLSKLAGSVAWVEISLDTSRAYRIKKK